MDIRCIEIIDEKIAAILRQKAPRERLEIAFGLWRTARTLLYNNLRSLHPDWNEETISREVSKRMAHGSGTEKLGVREIWDSVVKKIHS